MWRTREKPLASGALQLCFFETKSLTELELTKETRPTGQQAPGIRLLPPPLGWNYNRAQILFNWGSEDRTEVFTLAIKSIFPKPAISPTCK